MKYLSSALLALQFLTRIPVKFSEYPDQKSQGESLLFYPLIGLLIGLMLSVVALLLQNAPALLSAAILLALWVLITGALHLDGLADSCDAWIGGHGNKQRTLDIMQDPASGPIAVVMVLCTLLLKFTAMVAILQQQQYWLLMVAPLVARSLLPLLLLLTPYVRKKGIGAIMVANAPKNAVFISCAGGLLLALMLGSMTVILVAAIGLIGLRSLMIKRLDGLTGDTAGASLELVEMLTIVMLVIS